MQSFIQYRRIGLAVRKQLQDDHEKMHFRQTQVRNVVDILERDYLTASIRCGTTAPTDGIAGKMGQICSTTTAQTELSIRTALGQALTGIHVRD
jgi:hypothetical protein